MLETKGILSGREGGPFFLRLLKVKTKMTTHAKTPSRASTMGPSLDDKMPLEWAVIASSQETNAQVR